MKASPPPSLCPTRQTCCQLARTASPRCCCLLAPRRQPWRTRSLSWPLAAPHQLFWGQKRCLGVKEQKHSQSFLLHVLMNAWRWEKHTQSARGNSLHLALPSQSYQLRSFKKPKNPPGRFCLFKLTTSTDLRGLQGPFEPASSQGREPVEKFKRNPGCNSTARTSAGQNLQGQPT